MKNISNVKATLVKTMALLSILFYMSCDKTNTQGDASPKFIQGGDSVEVLPIAYINVDSLLTNYNLYKDASNSLLEKSKKADATLKSRQNQFENAVQDFQRKVQNNAFLSQERAQQEQASLQKQEMDLQSLAQRLQAELAEEQLKINNQIADSVRLNLKEYNKTANFEMILSNTAMDNVLFAKDAYDITNKIIELMNSRYKAEPAK